jgi:alkylation response protein AidB-like acyl-CoA dehydrogenase
VLATITTTEVSTVRGEPRKFMRDARVMTLCEGTSQVQKLLIGRAETGISEFV